MLRRITLVIVPLLLLVTACTQAPQPDSGSSRPSDSASASQSSSAGSAAPTSPSATPTPPTTPVHVSLLEDDGATFGVGMPIIAWFNRAPTDMTAFSAATTVTVNGSVVHGGWYFERTLHAGAVFEGHYRLQGYWPGHASIHMDLPVKGLSAGKGLSFDDSLTLDISTGAANIATVDAATLRMTVTSDGKPYGTFPVSLGAANTPTQRGTKVIMEKGADIPMSGPGYYDPHVQWTQRLTYGGEYLHSAPWNCVGAAGCTGPQNNIGAASSSNGCTNLRPADAKQLYDFLRVGDVVLFPNASGPMMQLGQGYGDWNVDWATWLTGGLLPV